MTTTSGPAEKLFVGVDGGGSSVVVRGLRGCQIAFSGTGGPANLTSTPRDELERNLNEALSGCPTPSMIAGCFAGIGNAHAREWITDFLRRRFPTSGVRLAPDYIAALLAGGDSIDVCCIAGTGSVCCSLVDNTVMVSGGLGHIFDDRGSAYRYGQALVGFVTETSRDDLPAAAIEAVEKVFGTSDGREITKHLRAAGTQPSTLAQLAPTLTALADARVAWAMELVDAEARALSRTVASHIRRVHSYQDGLRIGLTGGVWQSARVRQSFDSAMRRELPTKAMSIERLEAHPVEGALTLAKLPAEEVRWLDG